MKRLATIALALLAVSSAADSRKPPKGISLPRGCRDRGCARERTAGDGAAAVPCVATNNGVAFSAGWAADFNGGLTSTLSSVASVGPPGSCTSSVSRLQATAATISTTYSGMTIITPPTGSGTGMCSGGTSNISWGFYVLNASNQTFDMCWSDNLHGYQCADCSAVAATWTFCKVQNQTFWLTTNTFSIGNLPFLNPAHTARASVLDLKLYGPVCAVGPTISP